MGRVSSRWFNRYRAYKRRWTYDRDGWFSTFNLALTFLGSPPAKFIPITGVDPQERIDRDADEAEAAMDAGL